MRSRPCSIHCAPMMHETLGNKRAGGSKIFSFSHFNTDVYMDTAVRTSEIAEAWLT